MPRIASEAKAAIDGGTSVAFGPFTVGPNDVRLDAEAVSWDDLSNVLVDDGMVTLVLRSGRRIEREPRSSRTPACSSTPASTDARADLSAVARAVRGASPRACSRTSGSRGCRRLRRACLRSSAPRVDEARSSAPRTRRPSRVGLGCSAQRSPWPPPSAPMRRQPPPSRWTCGPSPPARTGASDVSPPSACLEPPRRSSAAWCSRPSSRRR
jgi:hypothetical protein